MQHQDPTPSIDGHFHLGKFAFRWKIIIPKRSLDN